MSTEDPFTGLLDLESLDVESLDGEVLRPRLVRGTENSDGAFETPSPIFVCDTRTSLVYTPG